MSNNVATVILILAIIIVLMFVGGFIFLNKDLFFLEEDSLSEEDFVQTNIIEETKTTTAEERDSINTTENDTETSPEEIITDPMLIQIANRYNSCSAVQEMRGLGYTMNATARQNRISINSSGDGLFFNVVFVCNDNILSTEIRVDTIDARQSLIRGILGLSLMDCVAQIKGYPERALTQSFNQDVASNYTLENEGAEIRNLNSYLDNSVISMKIDLESELSFLNK